MSEATPETTAPSCKCDEPSAAVHLIRGLFATLFVVAWIGGMVIAKGWLLKTIAFCTVIGGWYFFLERIFEVTGIIR
jgi:hypothetical protein